MATSKMQPSFAAGELAPSLRRRTDLAKYAVGLDTLKNMIVLPQGGAQLRTGTRFIHEIKTSSNKSRLVSFVFSITQAYILEFGDYYMRVYMDGGIVVSSGTTPYELEIPYPIADVWNLKFEQSADTLFVIHPNYAPRTITRTDHNAWTISTINFINGPLMNENDTGTTITLSNGSGDAWLYKDSTVTATASSGIFNSSHVGSIWGIRHISHAATYTITIPSSTDFTSGSYRVFGDWEMSIRPDSSTLLDQTPVYVEKSVDEGTTWFKLKTVQTTEGDASTVNVTGSEDDECLLRVVHNGASVDDSGTAILDVTGKQAWSYFKITGYTSSTVVTAIMQSNFNNGGSAFKSWAQADWSSYKGWPGAATFYQNRLLFGGNASFPSTYWASCVDDYYNNIVSIDQVEDESIKDRLPSRQVNAIEWMIPTQDLVVLTQDSEWTISPSSTEGVFSYKQKITKQRTFNGCNGNVKPVVIGDSVIFLKRNANKVQGMAYTDATGYESRELSVLAEHLFDGYTITAWAYQQNPNSILWCIRSDGALLSFTYMREQDVWAWSHHVTDGVFEDIGVIPGNTQDDVYFMVNRTVNGSTKRYIEMLAERNVTSKSSYFGVDCGASQTYESPTSTISGIAWLEKEKVDVIGDGIYMGKKTVIDGEITLSKAVSNVTIGLSFDWLLKTLALDSGIDRKKIVNSVSMSVVNSQGGETATDEAAPFNSLPYPTTDYYTGDLVDVCVNTDYNYTGQVIVRGASINPMHIVAITPKVTSGGN